jgi:hypothetical protein
MNTLKTLGLTLVTLFTISNGQTFRGPRKQLTDLVKKSFVENRENPSLTCSNCEINVCGDSIRVPDDIDCDEINDLFKLIKGSVFTKPTSTCSDKGDEYVCEVFARPAEILFENTCNDDYTFIYNSLLRDSVCSSVEYCPNLAMCSATYLIDCSYDSEILPNLVSFELFGNETAVTADQCPNSSSDDSDVKEFFSNWWETVLISTVISSIFGLVIMFIVLCCGPKTQIIREFQENRV